MTSYDLMIRTNHDLIKGWRPDSAQADAIVSQFLADRSASGQGGGRYPMFFIPPENGGRKFKTVLGQVPRTQILSANMFELETLRLLNLFAPEDAEVKEMTAKTLDRLRTTCFGYRDDGLGECFDASLVVLRFLAAAAPAEKDWIQGRIDNYNRHYGDKKRAWFLLWYYWLCLSELPFETARPELEKHKKAMLHWLSEKSLVMNSETDRQIHPVIFCMLRNALARYPEYAYIKERQPYVSDKDGRLHFDMAR